LPPERPARTPIFKRGGSRDPIVSSWRGLIVILLLLFAAPPLVGWIAHVVMSWVNAGS
jgi:hypothetical protein